MSTATIQVPSHARRKQFEIPLRLAAAILGVNFSHLRRVLNGERYSRKLSAAHQELVCAYHGIQRGRKEHLRQRSQSRSEVPSEASQ